MCFIRHVHFFIAIYLTFGTQNAILDQRYILKKEKERERENSLAFVLVKLMIVCKMRFKNIIFELAHYSSVFN